MKIIITASRVLEIELPEEIDPDDIDDFVVDEIRSGILSDWDLLGWEEIKSKAIA